MPPVLVGASTDQKIKRAAKKIIILDITKQANMIANHANKASKVIPRVSKSFSIINLLSLVFLYFFIRLLNTQALISEIKLWYNVNM